MCSGVLLAWAIAMSSDAQVRFVRGQDVAPTYDGWEQNRDGTFTLYFGYLNRNSEEALDIPLGPNNNFNEGDADRGQPTHFYPGRRWWVFKVVVPKDWPKDKRLVWTLTTRGKTNQAKGWLQAEWEVDKQLIAKDSPRDSFLVGIGEPSDDNLPPSITGSAIHTVTLPSTLTLTLTATDDGLPIPVPDPTGRRQQGVRIRWIQYRGLGTVRFDPEVSPAVYGKPATMQTKVSFGAPGSYRLRAIAMDGQLFSTYDVDVTVKRTPQPPAAQP
jgi:hypothetical protein